MSSASSAPTTRRHGISSHQPGLAPSPAHRCMGLNTMDSRPPVWLPRDDKYFSRGESPRKCVGMSEWESHAYNNREKKFVDRATFLTRDGARYQERAGGAPHPGDRLLASGRAAAKAGVAASPRRLMSGAFQG